MSAGTSPVVSRIASGGTGQQYPLRLLLIWAFMFGLLAGVLMVFGNTGSSVLQGPFAYIRVLKIIAWDYSAVSMALEEVTGFGIYTSSTGFLVY